MSRFCELVQSSSPELAMQPGSNHPWLYAQELVVSVMAFSAKQAKMIQPR